MKTLYIQHHIRSNQEHCITQLLIKKTHVSAYDYLPVNICNPLDI